MTIIELMTVLSNMYEKLLENNIDVYRVDG